MDALLSVPVAYRWIVTLLFVAFIIGLSVTPGIERPDDNIFSLLFSHASAPAQKVLHVVTYALLASLWMWTLAGIPSLRLRVALTIAITLTLGVALEWYQTTVPGRYGSLIDVLLNTTGIVIGIIAALLLL